MNIFSDIRILCVVIYLDDILIFSNSLGEHRVHVGTSYNVSATQPYAKPRSALSTPIRWNTLVSSFLSLWHSMVPSKGRVIRDWPVPRNLKELQSFLGFANFYRHFISPIFFHCFPSNSFNS